MASMRPMAPTRRLYEFLHLTYSYGFESRYSSRAGTTHAGGSPGQPAHGKRAGTKKRAQAQHRVTRGRRGSDYRRGHRDFDHLLYSQARPGHAVGLDPPRFHAGTAGEPAGKNPRAAYGRRPSGGLGDAGCHLCRQLLSLWQGPELCPRITQILRKDSQPPRALPPANQRTGKDDTTGLSRRQERPKTNVSESREPERAGHGHGETWRRHGSGAHALLYPISDLFHAELAGARAHQVCAAVPPRIPQHRLRYAGAHFGHDEKFHRRKLRYRALHGHL